MALARDLVEDDAGNPDARIVELAAERDGARRLRLSGDVDDEHDRPAEQRGDIGAGAGMAFPAGNPVEQPHRAFGDDDVRSLGRCAGDAGKQRVGHGVAVEIGAGCAGRSRMEGRVDIVRPAFQTAHGKPAADQRPLQAERDRGLAGAGARRGDE